MVFINIDDFLPNLIAPSTIIGTIMGIAEVLKIAGLLSKVIPLLDVFLGLVFSLFLYSNVLGQDVVKSAVFGIVLGLSACGLFSGIKNSLS